MQNETLSQNKCGSVLVAGAGIAGIQAALDLADSGYFVYLVEKESGIGGTMAKLDKTFPTNDCSMCILSPKLVEVGRHENIELLTLSTVEAVEGEAGDFTVTVKTEPRYVDPDKCIACGLCAEKCPVKVVDEYEQGLAVRKAAYLLYPQTVPLKYQIDAENCLYFKKGRCKACEKFCPAGAINFDDQPSEAQLNVGAIIFSAGLKTFDPSGLTAYQHSEYRNVVTSIEFERILAAGGPTGGEVVRLSDHKPAKRVAWLQCIGSRDMNCCDNEYCSGVCCMYAIKEAIIAKDHLGADFDGAIFYMDLRTSGKEFEKAYYRAEQEGIRFLRSRVHTITEKDDSGTLEIVYATEDGKNVREAFDLVVLSVGMEPADSGVETARRMGIALNRFNFVETGDLDPVGTSVPGIYSAGVINGCKDIPQSVVEAGAAACSAGELLSPARGSQVRTKTYPAERPLADEARIGVFVCNCGSNIGGYADVPDIVEFARTLPHVAYVEDNAFTCSQDTQDKIVQTIRDKELNRVVVAACTPRTHEPLFQDTIKEAGLNPYLFEMANIRNQCTWCHSKDKEKATEKCKEMVRMAVAKAAGLEPIPDLSVEIDKSALIVGGGIAGMNAALTLAEQGFGVSLIEKSPALGGAASQISQTSSGQDVQAYLGTLKKQVTENPAIDVLLNSEIQESTGFVGNFETTVLCGDIPRKIKHGVVIFATGGVAADTDEYLYHKSDRVTCWHDLEARGRELDQAKAVGFIQCVGSRDDQRPYCSQICCTNAISQAIHIKEKDPDKNIYIFYRDIRTPGVKELLYKKARELGVIFIRYDLAHKPEVKEADDKLEVSVFEPVLQRRITIEVDLLNLSTAIVPNDNSRLITIFKLQRNDENFLMEAHAKLRPVEFASDGLYLCGLAHYPKPIEESISQAKAAAAKAATVLSKDTVHVSPLVSQIDLEQCIGCGLCARVCPFGAIKMEEVQDLGVRPERIAASCKGCGVCAASCPQKAIDMLHFRAGQIEDAIAAAF